MAQAVAGYPVTLKAELTSPPGRWLWLVKWLLGIPHFIILAFLWIAAFVVTVVAFFVILFTGKYPKGLFDFNVGVMRWTWRVEFWSYGALATDKYPPFSLWKADYPADIDVEYPEKLSQGLVLIKWWLLAIPHYIIVGFFLGGGILGWQWGQAKVQLPGLAYILALFAGIYLLFTGRYPEAIFKLTVGMHRWGYRVSAYAGLMTDKYPPFRLWD